MSSSLENSLLTISSIEKKNILRWVVAIVDGGIFASVLISIFLSIHIPKHLRDTKVQDNSFIFTPDITLLSKELKSDSISLNQCFANALGLASADQLSYEHLSMIGKVKIRLTDESERGYSDYEFDSGLEAWEQFGGSLTQGDVIKIEVDFSKFTLLQKLSMDPNLGLVDSQAPTF